MIDRNGKTIKSGQTVRITRQWIDSLVSPGEYKVSFDKTGKLIIIPGVAIEELPSSIIKVLNN